MDSEKQHGVDGGKRPWNPSNATKGSSLPQSNADESLQSKFKRPKTSPAWENFTVISKVNSDGVAELRAKCNHCPKDYVYDPHRQGTSNYNRLTGLLRGENLVA